MHALCVFSNWVVLHSKILGLFFDWQLIEDWFCGGVLPPPRAYVDWQWMPPTNPLSCPPLPPHYTDMFLGVNGVQVGSRRCIFLCLLPPFPHLVALIWPTTNTPTHFPNYTQQRILVQYGIFCGRAHHTKPILTDFSQLSLLVPG